MMTDRTALLRERGIQVTAQRLAVLRAVSRVGRTPPPTAAADDRPGGDRRDLAAIGVRRPRRRWSPRGLIRRIQPAGSPARYEDRVGDDHHHVICRACGRVVDVDCASGLGAVPDGPRRHRGYEIDEAEVAYWGRCPDCLEESRTSSTADRQTVARQGQRTITHANIPTKSPTNRKRTSRSNNRRARRSSKG